MLMNDFCSRETGVGWAAASLSILREPPPQQWRLWLPSKEPFLSTVNSFKVFRQESGECAALASFSLLNEDASSMIDPQQ